VRQSGDMQSMWQVDGKHLNLICCRPFGDVLIQWVIESELWMGSAGFDGQFSNRSDAQKQGVCSITQRSLRRSTQLRIAVYQPTERMCVEKQLHSM
jgi:hypothetical protein